ncbi:MAG: putative PEP-binding protein [Treponema sp.]
MSITKHIHFISSDKIIKKAADYTLGIRGQQLNELAALGLPIVPGVIIDSSALTALKHEHISYVLKSSLKKMGDAVRKRYGEPENPLLLKVVVSSNLAINRYPVLHNLGLTQHTIAGFEKKVGKMFAANEVLFLLRGLFSLLYMIAELQNDEENRAAAAAQLTEIADMMQQKQESGSTIMEHFAAVLPADFFTNAEQQLDFIVQCTAAMLLIEQEHGQDAALIIQPLVYGNYGTASLFGHYTGRNCVNGDNTLNGLFFADKFDSSDSKGADINTLAPQYLVQLQDIARQLEDYTKDIREIRFTIEEGSLWLIEQKSAETKTTRSVIRLLLDLYKRNSISAQEVVSRIKPEQVHELLHPVLDRASIAKLPVSRGGIGGAYGAASGRVYFSTDALLEARRIAQKENSTTQYILCVPASYAGDVKAIEVADGVLSTEGGYAAHASVVARQYGKISLIRPDMKITGKKAVLNEFSITEGDNITLDVPYCGEPCIYLGTAVLLEPEIQNSGLLDFLDIVQSFVTDFHVRANADTPRDADRAFALGAQGIGLCRTEHLFFSEDRIQLFRRMILSECAEERYSVLQNMQKIQQADFYSILKAARGKPVTIRLLDAPLHEFLPHSEEELYAFIRYLSEVRGTAIDKQCLQDHIARSAEVNPMLGHRGCRIAISYPEIYAMQVKALFEAAVQVQAEHIDTDIEIMLPLVMNAREVKQIIFGKRIEGSSYIGITALAEEISALHHTKPIHYKVGTMIELPAAALSAGEIARYAAFFSFGTNDLTQTVLGLSRDDFTNFMCDYALYDLIGGNPFAVLDEGVKELIAIAIERGTLTRPDLKIGLCGEHSALPENIAFCMEMGMHYVSCTPYAVPIALLAIAQAEITKEAAAR